MNGEPSVALVASTEVIRFFSSKGPCFPLQSSAEEPGTCPVWYHVRSPILAVGCWGQLNDGLEELDKSYQTRRRVAAKIPVLAMDSPPLQQGPGWAHTLKPGMDQLHQCVVSENGTWVW